MTDLNPREVLAAMRKLGWAVEQLAQATGLTEPYLHRLLAGWDFSRRAAQRIADALAQEEARRKGAGVDKIT